MGIFGTIMNKIFHHPAAQQAQQPQAQAQAQPAFPQVQQQQPQQAQPAPQQPVDVEKVLTEMAQGKGGGGNWRSSIVDLLKLLDMDSSLTARKELANELNVHVASDGSAEENIALHKAVMDELAKNGGKVPETMRH